MHLPVNEKTQTFLIKQVSPLRAYLFTLAFIVCGLGILFTAMEYVNELGGWSVSVAFFISAIATLGGSIYAGFKLATAVVEITIDRVGLHRRWIKPYFLGFSSDRSIPWDNIANFVLQPDYNYEQLKIVLNNGSTQRIYHLNYSNAFSSFVYGKDFDDYSSFVFAFRQFLLQQKGQTDMPKVKTIYETKAALLISALLLILIIIPLLVTILVNPVNPMPYGILVLTSGASGYFIYQTVSHRRK